MSTAAKKAVHSIKHYFLYANPYKTVDSVGKLLTDHLLPTNNPDIVFINKPPGFQLSSISFKCETSNQELLFKIKFTTYQRENR
jgi:hypothetical protein